MLALNRRARVDPNTRGTSAHAVALTLDAVATQRTHLDPAPHHWPSRVLRSAAGLDGLVLPVLVALTGGVVSAWLLLAKIPE